MKKLLPFLFLALVSVCKADTTTPRLGLTLPTIGSPTWGQKINGNFQILDATVAINGQGGGGSGTSSLQIQLGGVQVSSPTATINFSSLTFTANQSPTGQANITSMVDVTGAQLNYQYLFNGSSAVWAPQGTSFTFAIATFDDGQAATQEIGTGVWKSTGSLSFTATYTNGPPIGSTITFSGWSALSMSFPFTSATSVANVNYPTVAGTTVFTLASQKTTIATKTLTHTFNNDRYWGVNAISVGSYTSADIRALSNHDLTNSIPNTFTVSPGAGQYIVYAYPSRLGTATFSVGGFAGGFNPAVTASVTNASGYTENYSVYSSVNSNLGSTTVVVTTP